MTFVPLRPSRPSSRPSYRPAPVALAVLGLAIALEAAAQSASPAPAGAPAAADSDVLTIEVTASKRKERLQDVPATVSVLDETRLERLGVARLADYAALVPSVAIGSGAGPGIGALIVRGMTTGVEQQTATTVTYLGETPFTGSGGLTRSALTAVDPDLFDVERIEVLKGPQGTLYGAGSLGGLVRLVPRAVDLRQRSGRVALGANQAAGGDRGHTARLALNLPLVTDTLGVALQGFDRTDPGFVRNVLTGHDHLGTTRASGGSLTARYQPTRDLSLTFRAANQAADTRGAASQDNVVGTGTPAYGERAYAATFDRGIRTRYGLRELTLEAALAQGTLTATANRALIKVLAQEDYTAAYAPLVAALTDARNVFGVPLNDPPFVPASVRADITPRVDKTSFELRFAAHRVGALEYLVGLFATREKNLYANHLVNVDAAGAPYSGAVLGFDAGSPTFTRLYERGTLVQSDLNSSYRESAVFGNVGVHFSEAVDATLGLRHAENRQSATSTSPPPGVGFINLGNYTLRSSDSATTTLATLRYRPAADLSTYARIASGYRPGGTQATPAPPPTYAPDRVVNVEVGAKLQRDGLGLEVAAYHVDWDRVQLNSLTNGVPVLRNGGRAKIDGVELQAQWRPGAGFEFGAALGFNRARLTAIDAATAAATGARPGDALPNAPRRTLAAFGEYRFALGTVPASTGVTLKHSGPKPSGYSADPLNVPYTVPAFTTLDVRLGLDFGTTQLRLGIDNLTDRNGVTSYTTVQVIPGTVPTSTAWLTRPRTVGLQVEHLF